MVALEYFKNNLVTIEETLGNDAVEPLKHVDMYFTWFRWVDTHHDSTLAHRDHLHLHSMPKVARSLLKRQYKEDKDIFSVRDALQNFLQIAIRRMGLPEMAALLPVLLDPKHVFYLRHGFPKPKPPSTNKRKYHAQSPVTQIEPWKLELEEGSCVDVLVTDRCWQLGIIESINKGTKEIKVSLPDESISFFRLDDDRVAPYASKTELFGGATDGPPSTEVVFDVSDDPPSAPMVIDVDGSDSPEGEEIDRLAPLSRPSQWRSSLNTGSLIDVKTKSGAWQQACICELREITLAEARCLDTRAVGEGDAQPAAVVQDLLVSDTEGVAADRSSVETALETSSDEDLDDMVVQVSDSPPPSPTPMPTTVLIAEPAGEITTTFARAAMIGMSEGSDEWVDAMDATCVQPLDSMSGGKRGEAIVRDEILYFISTAAPGVNKDITSRQYMNILYLLYSPFYVDMIEMFYCRRGYYEASKHIFNSAEGGTGVQRVPLDVAMHLIIAVGLVAPFLDKTMEIEPNFTTLLSAAMKRLAAMSLQETRETSTELLERVLSAVEDLSLAIFGLTDRCGKVVEQAFLRIAKNYLNCPFLNRRLWGLKRLTEMVNRCRNAEKYPSGLRVERTITSPEGEAGSSSPAAPLDPIKKLATENVHYRVVKVSFSVTSEFLCDHILEEGYITQWFIGDSAHSSLMQRASDGLCFLAQHGKLPLELLKQLWEVGYVHREPAALSTLVDVTKELSLPSLQMLLDTISSVAGGAITSSVVDIAAAIGHRLHLSSASGEPNAALQSMLSAGPDESAALHVAADKIFVQNLLLLWQWTSDSSGVDITTSAQALTVLETLVGTCMTPLNSLHRVASYDWNKHWKRTIVVIKTAFKDLTRYRCIVPAIRLVHAAVLGWPKMATGPSVRGLPLANELPFEVPTRSSVAEYLDNYIGVMGLIGEVVIELKKIFSNTMKGIHGSRHRQGGWIYSDASEDMQAVLNASTIGSARYGYTETLERCFDFVNFFARCSIGGSIRVDFEMLQSIWNTVLKGAVTVKERDAVVSFVSRLVQIRNIGASQVTPQVSGEAIDTDSLPKEGPTTERNNPVPGSILKRSDVGKVFRALLCDKKFIESTQLNCNGFNCIERYFRWINKENGGVVEFVGPDAKYMVSQSLTRLEGWEIFLQIMLCCSDVSVALQSIKFFTSLVNKFSIELIESGEIGRHYGMLVDLSMSMLGHLRKDLEAASDRPGAEDDIVSMDDISVTVESVESRCGETVGMRILEEVLSCAETGDHRDGEEIDWVMVEDSVSAQARRQLVLQRILMLLTAVLDESATDAGRHNVLSHDARSRSEPIEFKITGAGKKKCLNLDSLKMLMTDRLGDLLARIEQNLIAPYTLANVKVFHRGKDLSISSASDKLKTFSNVHFSNFETLMVVEKPNVQPEQDPLSSATAVVAPATASSIGKEQKGFVGSYTVPLNELPVMLLSNNQFYFDTLFSMLEHTSGELTTSLWTLILRLPTSQAFLSRWLNLNGQDMDVENCILELFGVTGTSDDHHLNVPRLVYSIQIIENIMDSNTVGNDDSEIATEDWIQSFSDKGGVNALVSALKLAAHHLENYVEKSIANKLITGSSGVMLLQALTGVTKLVRFFLLSLCNSSSIDTFRSAVAPLLFNSTARERIFKGESSPSTVKAAAKVRSLSDKQTSAFVEDLTELTVGDIFNDGPTDGVDLAAPKAMSECGADDTNADNMELVLSAEWGGKHIASVKMSEPDRDLLVQTQETLLYCFTYLRHFSDIDYVSSTAKSLLNVSDLCVEEMLLSVCAENMLVMWGAVCAVDSAVSVQLSDEKLVLTFLESVCRSRKIGSSPNHFPGRLTTWLLQGLLDVLSLVKEVDQSHYELFCRRLSSGALSLRPSLASVDVSAPPMEYPIPEIDLLCKMIDLSDDLNVPAFAEADVKELGVLLYNELTSYAASQHVNKSSCGLVNGSLQLLCKLSGQNEDLLRALFENGIIEFVLRTCLGLQETESVELWSLCQDTVGQSFAYAILLNFAQWQVQISEDISERIRKVHVSAVEALRLSEDGPVKAKSTADTTSSVAKGLMKGTFKPERDVRSAAGYCGIRNLGCTCYMNSLMQVLYMIPEVRAGVLAFPIDTRQLSEEAKADNLLLQLQKMFLFLSASQRKAYNPENWATAYKDDSGVLPINVTQQQDAQEYLQVLCERLESQYYLPSQIEGYVQAGSASEMEVDGVEEKTAVARQQDGRKFDILQKSFGGKISNQMMRQGGESDIREKEESFVCISLDVAGTTGLENSLSKFVAGETISDFQWNDGEPREPIVKRQCLSELSNTVIFHLKRFELNFDTFLREKVNDAFPFPTLVNLFPYSKEGLQAQTAGSARKGSHSARPDSYYIYELQGIVVHTGTTDSGHYFSYIRETDSFTSDAEEESKFNSDTEESIDRRWIEFNDSEVSVFSESLIAPECFGGMTTSYDVSNKEIVQRQIVNPKSAYMLVYRRVRPLADENERPFAVGVPNSVVEEYKAYNAKLRKDIDADNHRHMLCTRVFTQPHVRFMVDMFDNLKAYGSLSKSTWTKEGSFVGRNVTILEDYVVFALKVAARTAEFALFKLLCSRVIECLLVVREVSNVPTGEDTDKENIPTEGQMDTSNGDDEAEALALSLSLQVEPPSSTPKVTTGSTACSEKNVVFSSPKSRTDTCVQLLSTILSEFDDIYTLLYHNEATTRMVAARLLVAIYSLVAMAPDSLTPSTISAVPEEIWKGGAISSTQIKVPADIEVEAGKVTDISVIENPPVAPSGAAEPNAETMQFITNNSTPGNLAIKFLLELTTDEKVQCIAEHWRRSDAICWMLHDIAEVNWQTRYVLTRRELVVGICDIFLGDQSVTGAGLFVQGSRKRAPSSYAHVPHVKAGTVNHHAKNLPDWTLLLDTLAMLVTDSVNPESAHYGRNSNPLLRDLSEASIKSKVLYSTALKQARYIPALCKIVQFNCFENFNTSNDFAEAIGGSLSMCSADAVYHIFNAMSHFFSIPDNLATSRVGMLFSGELSVLDMVKMCQESRSAFVSVFIKSVMELADRDTNVYNNLSCSAARIEHWAPWMLQFSFQNQGKTKTEAASLAALGKGNNPGLTAGGAAAEEGKDGAATVAVKGPYLPIFGEEESNFEKPAVERAEMCFQRLQNMLVRMGANPDALIPDDAFIELPPDEATIGAAFDLTNDVPIEIDGQTVVPSGDHMTDEEFARYLQTQT